MTAVTDGILAEYWRLHPVEATHAGVHDFDASPADLSAAGFGARRDWRARCRTRLQAEPVTDADDALDRRVLLRELTRQDIVDEDWQWPRRAPMLYLEQALNGLQYALARPAADGSAEALAARVAAIPRLLADGQRNLRGELVPAEYVEISLVATAGAQRFLADLEVVATAAGQVVAELDRPVAAALTAVAEFDRFLRQDLHPTGAFALGQDLFERMLREVHGVPLSADDVYQHGQDLAASLSSALGPTWRADVEALKADHPSPDTLLQTYADEALRARQFVEAHQLVNIPAGERFEVRPTA
ncbi:MAG: DUF885 family protein, partial [Chloroflexi bacterium]|nr:DUF885 family protein [Chloroflexota bacterium]